MAQALIIKGGGLAGLACAIRLKELGCDPRVYERQHYPLKKVCGEFLSPSAWDLLVRLGASRHLDEAPVPLSRARFFYSPKKCFDFRLDPGAWGLSRQALDMSLARRLREMGCALREGEAAPDGAAVDAGGKVTTGGRAAWMGWKGYLPAAEAPDEMPSDGLLMLPLNRGYCGLAPVEGKRINVCLVARAPSKIEELLASHPVLAGVAGKIQPFAAIAGFDFMRRAPAGRIGDAAAAWPPLVGDGMSRALKSGLEMAESLAAGGEAKVQASPFQFFLSKSMHSLMLSQLARALGGPALSRLPGVPEALYRFTRA